MKSFYDQVVTIIQIDKEWSSANELSIMIYKQLLAYKPFTIQMYWQMLFNENRVTDDDASSSVG